jgi:hypothetical protein
LINGFEAETETGPHIINDSLPSSTVRSHHQRFVDFINYSVTSSTIHRLHQGFAHIINDSSASSTIPSHHQRFVDFIKGSLTSSRIRSHHQRFVDFIKDSLMASRISRLHQGFVHIRPVLDFVAGMIGPFQYLISHSSNFKGLLIFEGEPTRDKPSTPVGPCLESVARRSRRLYLFALANGNRRQTSLIAGCSRKLAVR